MLLNNIEINLMSLLLYYVIYFFYFTQFTNKAFLHYRRLSPHSAVTFKFSTIRNLKKLPKMQKR